MSKRAASKVIKGLEDALKYAKCEHQWVFIKRATQGPMHCWMCTRCGAHQWRGEKATT